jgi:hypothetical protein
MSMYLQNQDDNLIQSDRIQPDRGYMQYLLFRPIPRVNPTQWLEIQETWNANANLNLVILSFVYTAVM